MAAGKWKMYAYAKELIGLTTANAIDLNHTIGINLYTSASNCNALPQASGLAVRSSLTNQVATGGGYTQDTKELTGVTLTESGGIVTWDADDVTWTGSGGGFTARYAVLYDKTNTNYPLIGVCVLDTTPADVVVTSADTLVIQMSASGIFTFSGATVD
jgi:hypothetical protein